MQSQHTTNYAMFSHIQSNREVGASHVSSLVKKIKRKNLLHLNPIIVNKDNLIIDGQHRLEAAKTLMVPIYYIVSDGITNADIADLNSTKKNWNMHDYLNFWKAEGMEQYKIISRFVVKHPQIPLSVALSMLGNERNGRLNIFKEGKFVVVRYEQACKIAEQIEKLSADGCKFAYNSTFIRVYKKLFSLDRFDFERLLSQIAKQPRSLVPCVHEGQYKMMIEEIYNYELREQNRIYFR